MRIRVGIVGLQSVLWPHAFANCLNSISTAELVACASIGWDPSLISISLGKTPEEYAAQYHVRLYHDPTEMIQKEDWDPVCICAKHTKIANFVEQVAPSEVNVYIAKPMATTLEAADRIVKAVRNHNLIATSGTTERFDGGIREAYQRFKSGAIGELISIQALHQHGNISGFPKGDCIGMKSRAAPNSLWFGMRRTSSDGLPIRKLTECMPNMTTICRRIRLLSITVKSF